MHEAMKQAMHIVCPANQPMLAPLQTAKSALLETSAADRPEQYTIIQPQSCSIQAIHSTICRLTSLE
jgi:hypothetical protein